jgi:two-component system response regulator HydG
MYKRNHIERHELNSMHSLNEITAEVEKENIIKVLIETKGNKAKAAKLLNIDRSSLYNKLKKYGIDI